MFDKSTYRGFTSAPILFAWLVLTVFFFSLSLSSCRKAPHLEWPIKKDLPSSLEYYINVDTNLVRIANYTNRAQQLDSLLVWTEWLRKYDASAALRYAEEAYKIATKYRYEKAQAVSAYYLALLPGRQALYSERMEEPFVRAGISRRIFMRGNDLNWKIKINNLLGNLWYRKGQLDSAQYYLNTALRLTQEKELNPVRQALQGEVYHNLWSVQLKQDSVELAETSFQKAFALYEASAHETAKDRLILDAAQSFSKAGNYEVADSLFRLSIDLAIAKDDDKHLAKSYQRYGSMRFKQYNASRDEQYFADVINYAKTGLQYQDDNYYYNYGLIAKAYLGHAGQNSNHVDSALVYYKKAFVSAQEESAISFFKNISDDIARLCSWRLKVQGRSCEDILGIQEINSNYTEVVDEISESLMESSENFLAFEVGEMETAVQRRVRNIWILVGIGTLMAGFIFLLIYFRQQQQRLRAQMQALRAQINPHFISNSLNAIESLVNLDQREAAAKYLIHFSRLSRRILNGSMAPFTSLAGEIETLKHFLALEQLRFRNKLQYSIELSPELEANIIQVPSLILQPYIENAIWHGIKPKKGVGFLEISVHREGKELVCVVEDDGVGREKAMELKAKTVLKHKSVGMKITKQRLEAISRFKGGRVVITDLYHDNGEAAGTKVAIRFPYKTIKTKTTVA